MSIPRSSWLFPSLASLALGMTPALADESSWQKAHDAGWKAYQESRFDKPGKSLRTAENEARTFGDKDPRLATTLDHLAWVLCAEGRYKDAEPLARWALTWREKLLGAEHPDVMQSLDTLACLYDAEGEAEPFYKRALALVEPLAAKHR
jgi:hypothetical protein